MLFMGMGDEIDSEKASKRMGELTRPFFDRPITISIWRHINIAFKRVFCKEEIEGEMDKETMDSIYALQADHSVRTENRIYGLSSDIISASSGHLIMLYIGISYKWQKVLGVPPGGLGLDYRTARMQHFDDLVSEGKIKLGPQVHPDPCVAIAELAEMLQEERKANAEMAKRLEEERKENKEAISNLVQVIEKDREETRKEREENRRIQSQLLEGMNNLCETVKELKSGQGKNWI